MTKVPQRKRIKRAPFDAHDVLRKRALQEAHAKGCSLTAGKVLGEFAAHMKFSTRAVRRSQKAVAVDLGFNIRTVERAMVELIENELLHDYDAGVRRRVHRYKVLMDCEGIRVVPQPEKLPDVVRQPGGLVVVPLSPASIKRAKRGTSRIPLKEGECNICGKDVIPGSSPSGSLDHADHGVLFMFDSEHRLFCNGCRWMGKIAVEKDWPEAKPFPDKAEMEQRCRQAQSLGRFIG